MPQGGLFGWSFNDVEAGVLKYPWSTELGAPRPLGVGGLTWNPVLLGSAGTAYFVNRFRDGPLAGNESTYTTYSLGLGAGARIGLLPDLSVCPPSASSTRTPRTTSTRGPNPDARPSRRSTGSSSTGTRTRSRFVPSLALRYRPSFGRVTLGLTSSYTYFATVPIERSTEAYSFTSESQVWNNRVEVDVVTPWAVAGWPILVGGFLNRAELYGGLRQSLKTDHYYSTGAHVALDPKGRLWKVTEVGVAGSYFWAESFSGWTLGIDWAVAF